MYRRAIEPRRLVVDCEGYRSDRDRALHDEALALAAAVAGDGVPRKMRALNSYERRIVHAALTGHPAVHTFSVGEGGERRVTVAPKPPAGENRG
jgi:spoIIIJ-associated protein